MSVILKSVSKLILLILSVSTIAVFSPPVAASDDMRLDMAMEELAVRNAAASYAAIADAGFNLEDAKQLFDEDVEFFEKSKNGGDKSSEPTAVGIVEVMNMLREKSKTFSGQSTDAMHIVGASQIISMGWRIEHTCLTMTNVLTVSKAGDLVATTHQDNWVGDGLGSWKIVRKTIFSD